MGRDKVEKTDVSPTNRSLEAAFDDSAEEDLNINANEDRGYAEPHAGEDLNDAIIPGASAASSALNAEAPQAAHLGGGSVTADAIMVDGEDGFDAEGMASDLLPPPEPHAVARPGRGARGRGGGGRGRGRGGSKSGVQIVEAGQGFKCNICLEATGQLLNRGSAQYPSWRHSECHNAAARLACGAQTDLEKKALSDLKKNKSAYRLRILELIHTQLEDGHNQRSHVQHLLETLVVSSALLISQDVEMMDKDSYIAHCMYKFRLTEEKAMEKWQEDIVLPESVTETEGGVTTIAVPRNKIYTDQKKIELRRQLDSQRAALRTKKEIESGHKRAFAVMNNSVVNPSFSSAPGAQAALLHNRPDRMSVLDLVNKKRKEDDSTAAVGNLTGVVDADGASTVADSLFESDPAVAGPRETALVNNLKIIERQKLLCELEANKKTISQQIKAVEKIMSGAAYLGMRDSDREALKADDFVLALKDGVLQNTLLTEKITAVQMNDGDVEQEMQPLREETRTSKQQVGKWQLTLESMTQAAGRCIFIFF